MNYTFKWLETYEKKYNITKDSLIKGIKVSTRSFNCYDDFVYFLLKDDTLYFAYDNFENSTTMKYNDNESPLANMLHILDKWWGTEIYNRNILKSMFDSGLYTRGIKK